MYSLGETRARNYNLSEEKKARGDNYASIATLINASSTVDELAYQLRASKSSVLLTCIPLLATALEAASKCGIPHSRVYILEMPQELLNGLSTPAEFTTMSRLIEKVERSTDFASEYDFRACTDREKVPPVIVSMVKNEELMKIYDLGSVHSIITGAAPLGLETAEQLGKLQQSWSILQAYGLTETTAVATATSPHDIFFGSPGSLLPSIEARLVLADGDDIEEYDTPGKLLLRGPTIVLGYLNNDAANKATFQNGWLRTGDEAVLRKSAKGEDHVFIVDRIKELIEVKPVIAVINDDVEEVPKAYVVKAMNAPVDDHIFIRDIKKHVSDHKARYKWLRGGVEVIDVIPKTASGKILRRHLRDRDRGAKVKTKTKARPKL
ncbi:hypothetical protein HCAG_00348 [Histoplasma mississippiense (nom. inval.)]|uniref:hypothetical protein n=1 Tax=Ajellomyces capsulatus (strain NAm1 / WU24) TaxID=2059318 RepID=UPI000157B6D1|nr:hypothetical protein HCAG_00348 [Histoplasma mississippiense (nom. inval.)]EDN02484.1 hypothetical protein HCAG_00348 [Histoplasma mississippiense (nom. inval.)]